MKNSLQKLEDIENLGKSQEKLMREIPPEGYAAIYGRISGQHDSFSIESQLEDCKRKALAENLIVYRAYTDEKSARKIHYNEREGFKNLLADLEAGMFKTVIITRRDRLSRRIDDFMQIRKIFKNQGVKVIYANEGEFDSNDQSYITSFIENMIMAISTLEPDYISERTSAGRKHLREQGIYQSARPPYGYVKDDTQKHKYHKNEGEAKVVEKVFKLFTGITADTEAELKKQVRQLIEKLKKDDELAKFLKKKSNHQFIYKIIEKPIYAGFIPNDTKLRIQDLICIDAEDTFQLDEEKLIVCENFKDIEIIDYHTWKIAITNYLRPTLNGPKVSPDFLFKGILYCGKCNKSIKLIDDKYTCGDSCINLDAESLIKLTLRQLIKDISPESIKEPIKLKLINTNKELTQLKQALRKIEIELKKHIHDYIKDSSDDEAQNSFLELEKQKEKLKDKITFCGDLIRELTYYVENINNFKLHIMQLQQEDINFFKDNWEICDDLIKKNS